MPASSVLAELPPLDDLISAPERDPLLDSPRRERSDKGERRSAWVEPVAEVAAPWVVPVGDPDEPSMDIPWEQLTAPPQEEPKRRSAFGFVKRPASQLEV
jgi:hypothetical protein